MNRIKLNIKSPWPVLISLCMAVMFVSVIALADHDDDNYEKQKAAIDRANDGIVGYTHDGLPVYESEIPDGELLGQAIGLRQLEIVIKGISKISTDFVNNNSVKITLKESKEEFIIIFSGCELSEIDNFQFQTRGDGKLNVGDFAFVRRNPFKYFDNPNLELSREQVESKLKDWDFDERTCVIAGLQENIEIPIALEDVRG